MRPFLRRSRPNRPPRSLRSLLGLERHANPRLDRRDLSQVSRPGCRVLHRQEAPLETPQRGRGNSGRAATLAPGTTSPGSPFPGAGRGAIRSACRFERARSRRSSAAIRSSISTSFANVRVASARTFPFPCCNSDAEEACTNAFISSAVACCPQRIRARTRSIRARTISSGLNGIRAGNPAATATSENFLFSNCTGFVTSATVLWRRSFTHTRRRSLVPG